MQFLTSKVSSCSPYQKKKPIISKANNFYLSEPYLVKRGKALRMERKLGTVLVCNWKEEREKSWLKSLIPRALHWTEEGGEWGGGVGGLHIHVKTGGLDQNALQQGKNWHEERSAQIAWGLGVCFKMAIPRASTTIRLKPHEQGTVWGPSPDSPTYLSPNT